jgi:hypothetical protein
MRIAIMQPYAFPYLGYFQLISAVDLFVLLDDANFINRGFVNRNTLLTREGPRLFTIPLSRASSTPPINQLKICTEATSWKKLPRRIRTSYARAPHFREVMPLLEHILEQGAFTTLTGLIRNSLRVLLPYLGIETRIVESTTGYDNYALKGVDRIVDICRKEGAQEYLNPEGGRALYSREKFEPHGITLQFLIHMPVAYPQFGDSFVERLSIIDAMMFNSPDALRNLLMQYRIEPALG